MKKHLLKAGAARGDITPKILPVPFFLSIEMDRVVEPIYVRVLDIDNGENRVLFVTFDMTVIPNYDETIKHICEYTGLKKEQVFIAATHTHEAPLPGFGILGTSETSKQQKNWYDEILKTLKDTIKKAEDAKIPARMGYNTGKSYINVNRDIIVNGKGELGSNFERPSDKTLALVRLEGENGKPIAFIVNYAVHAVVMNGCLVNGAIGICGDLPGKTSLLLEEKFEGAVALWTSGAAGDQNPRIMTQYIIKSKDGENKVHSLGEAGYIILDSLAQEHVNDILAVNSSLVCENSEANIFCAEKIVECPGRVSDLNRDAAAIAYTLRLLTIGDMAFEGISAEVVTSIGTELKKASPLEKTMVVTNANGYCGYVPDDWGYENHTFEANGTPVEKGCAQPAFLNGFEKLFKEKAKHDACSGQL